MPLHNPLMINSPSSSPPSQTSHAPRRPRSLPPPPLATPTTITSASLFTTAPLPTSPLSPSSAISYAAATAPALNLAATRPCRDASLLSSLLADVVATLDRASRTFWCQMMDTLALRTAAGDVLYSLSIAPHLPSHAEDVYVTHHNALATPLCPADHPLSCPLCRRLNRSHPSPHLCLTSALSHSLSRPMEFSWVEDEEDDPDEQPCHTHRLPIPSFEAYICDVLDEKGRNEFVKERFYGGAPLNSRYLLAKFGSALGISGAEADFRAADLFSDNDVDISDDDYVARFSDVESLDRSDNGLR